MQNCYLPPRKRSFRDRKVLFLARYGGLVRKIVDVAMFVSTVAMLYVLVILMAVM